MQFIDTHCHLSDPAFEGDTEAVIAAALDAGVCKMLQADTCSAEREAMLSLCKAHPGVLYPMVGLYPGYVTKDWQSEVDEVYRLATEPDFIAIGEIGLDYHFSIEFKDEQKDALKAQLELASRLGLPVNIHLRDATDDFFDVLDSCRNLNLRGNLHAFSGSAQTARRVRNYGEWSVGIGGVLTFKNAHIAKELEDIPMEMIMLETDAPYLTPTPFRGTRNDSSHIPLIAAKVAEIKGISIEEVAQVTSANALRLFDRIQ